MEEFTPGRKIVFFSVLLCCAIIPFVIFDALQQKYYLDTFNLWPQGQPYSVLLLLKAHLIRWSAWVVGGIPLVIYALKNSVTVKNFSYQNISIYALSIVVVILFDVAIITGIYVINAGDFSSVVFSESFEFFLYQKAPVFFISYTGLITLTHFYKEREQLTIQIFELKELKDTNKIFYNELKRKSLSDSEKIISVRIGNKLKQLSISEIEWIESDNYCVKLHTPNGSFTIRASMKYLEKFLPEAEFIRVHRNAIVKRAIIEELDISGSPIVKLRNGETLKVALSRLGKVRRQIKSEVA